MKKYLCLFVVICSTAIIGCTTRLADFTIFSTKNIELSKFDTFTRGTQRSSGRDAFHMCCVIPLGGPPNLKEAIDRAIEKVPGGVALLDGVLSLRSIFIPYVYVQQTYMVEGTVLVDPALMSKSSDTFTSDYLISFYNPKVKDQVVSSVSEDDYNKITSAYNDGDGAAVSDILTRVFSL